MSIRPMGFVAVATAAVALVWSSGATVAARQSNDQRNVKTIDAITLALAVRAGQFKQYEGYKVTGEGRSFDTNCTPADAAKKIEASIPLTLAALGKDGKPQPIATLEEVVNYQTIGRAMLVVKLRGADLKIKPEPDPQHPVLYTFTAKFMGETESVTPPPSILDNHPTPYTVPILIEATAR
jgi:hypothetical protein